MTDPVTVHFDGEKYLVLNIQADCWGEGVTLDDAYGSYKSKILERGLSSCDQSSFGDVGLIYLAHRKKIVYFLTVTTFVFAMIIVINAIPSYLNKRVIEIIGSAHEARLKFESDNKCVPSAPTVKQRDNTP